jgi:quinol monooxygenase YgiN
MIIVHDTFVCKPGNASKLAKLFKETMGSFTEVTHILTDMTGQYNRVVMVSQYEDLAAYQKSFDAYSNPTPEMKESMKKMENYTEMYQTGGREVYKVW